MINIEQIKDKLQNRKLSTVGRHTFFSVLVPFVEMDGEIHILYEIRSQVIPTQPGEVCFPGGAIEPGETAREAAIRFFLNPHGFAHTFQLFTRGGGCRDHPEGSSDAFPSGFAGFSSATL